MRLKRTSRPSAVPTHASAVDLVQRREAAASTRKARAEQARRDMEAVVTAPYSQQGILTDFLNRSMPPRRPARDGDYLHVSDLLGKCIRKRVLGMRFGSPSLPDRLSMSDLLAFAQGDAIHDVVKDSMRVAAPRHVWGRWSCKCENLKHEEPCTHAETDPNDICEYCGTPTDKYHEVPMRDDDTMIVGTPDLLLYFRELDAFYINEIKSMAASMWKELARPLPDHVLQVVFYWYLMRKLGYKVCDKVSIIYVTKDYLFVGKPYKEFIIDPEAELHRLDRYIEDAYAFKAAREDANAQLPARICSGEVTPEAKKCSMCKMCFSME